MRTSPILATVAVVLLFTGGTARADLYPIAEIHDAVGDPHQLTITDTTTDVPFSFDVILTLPFNTVSAQMKVQALDGSGIFELTSRSFDAAEGWSTSAALPFYAPDDLTGSPGGISSQDIGTLASDVMNGIPAGTVRLMTVDALVKAGTPDGTYRLNLGAITIGNTLFQEIPGVPGQDYRVTVIPAPAAAPLALLGLGVIAGLRRRLS